jgi:hypothetical protein
MKSISQTAKSINSQISSMLIEKGYEGIETKQYIYTYVAGLKTEWWFAAGLMRVGHSSNRTENELELIKDRLTQKWIR